MLISFIQKLGKNKVYIAIVAIVFSLTLFQWIIRLIPTSKAESSEVKNEIFNMDLESLNSMESLSIYIDSMSLEKGIDRASQEEYVNLIDGIIRERFYHGKSHIKFSDNFIAWIAGNTLWSHLYVGVIPDEILSHPNALCSQSAIIFQEIVKKKGFKVRAVGLNRHFCSEIYYEGSWHFMDSDKEPTFDKTKPIPSTQDLSNNESLLEKAYVRDSETVSLEQMNEIFNADEILFFNENVFPAKNMRFFQSLTKYLSDYLWLILILPIVLSLIKLKSTEQTS